MKNLIIAAAVLVTLPALAQGPMGPMGPHMDGPGMDMRQPLTNAPYSATFTRTATEKLQDGSTLTRTTTRVASRDSLGRTREEVTMPARHGETAPKTMVVIFDPVAHTTTRLDAEKKIASVHTLPQRPAREGRAGAPPAGERPRGPREDKNVVTTDLGSKTIDGVPATGKRTTRTVPAGEMGNTSAIVSTHERWTSADLKIELSRTDVDPFHGTDTLVVSNLTKAEPQAALFTVPAGYTVQQEQERGWGGRGGDGRGAHGAPPPPPAK